MPGRLSLGASAGLLSGLFASEKSTLGGDLSVSLVLEQTPTLLLPSLIPGSLPSSPRPYNRSALPPRPCLSPDMAFLDPASFLDLEETSLCLSSSSKPRLESCPHSNLAPYTPHLDRAASVPDRAFLDDPERDGVPTVAVPLGQAGETLADVLGLGAETAASVGIVAGGADCHVRGGVDFGLARVLGLGSAWTQHAVTLSDREGWVSCSYRPPCPYVLQIHTWSFGPAGTGRGGKGIAGDG